MGIIFCPIGLIDIASTAAVNTILSLATLTLYISYLIPIDRHLCSSEIIKSTNSLWTFETRPGSDIHQYLRHRIPSFPMHLPPLSSEAVGDKNHPELLKSGCFSSSDASVSVTARDIYGSTRGLAQKEFR